MRRIVPLALVALFAASCGQSDNAPPKEKPAPPARGELPPELTIAAWFGSEPLTLEGSRGKVVVLDFWNTTCAPCRALMPHLAELYTKHKAAGLVVIGITEDDLRDLEPFLKKNPVAYPIAADKLKGGAGVTFDAYKIGSIPTVCLIARDGTLAWKGPGEKLTAAAVEAELAKK